ncbi:MAG: hypothetical protein GC204_03620 [Chloroflexi bacterium]|nr:hypothetical protein [Chloroflexota bacterium]
MVTGIDKFREFFKDHGDQYVLIGGTACDLLFGRAGIDFRNTRDFDMVICVEVVDKAFAMRFAEFLVAGGYKAIAMSDGEKKFYRFAEPADATFPTMIELFARPKAAFDLPESDRYARLTVEDEALSLSALLLDADYYAAAKEGRTVLNGVSILDETLLIPFKARAYLDMTARREKGEKIDSGKIKKHCNDIFRLAQLLPREGSLKMAKPLQEDVRQFLKAVAAEQIDMKAIGVKVSQADAVAVLQRIYDL